MKNKTSKKASHRQNDQDCSDHVHSDWLKKWLAENYVMNEDTSLQSQLVYTHYTYSCSAQGIGYVDHMSFFEVMKEVFPAVELKKLPGKRDKDGWEFGCIDILPSSEEYTTVAKGRKINNKMVIKRSVITPDTNVKKTKTSFGSRSCVPSTCNLVPEERSVKEVSTNTYMPPPGESNFLCDRCQCNITSPQTSTAGSPRSSVKSKAGGKSQKFFLSIECVRNDLDSDEFIVSVRADSAVDVCTSNSAAGSNATLTVRPQKIKDNVTASKVPSGSGSSYGCIPNGNALRHMPERTIFTSLMDRERLESTISDASAKSQTCTNSEQHADYDRVVTDGRDTITAAPPGNDLFSSEEIMLDEDSVDNSNDHNLSSAGQVCVSKIQKRKRRKKAKRLTRTKNRMLQDVKVLHDRSVGSEVHESQSNQCDALQDNYESDSTTCEQTMDVEQNTSNKDISTEMGPGTFPKEVTLDRTGISGNGGLEDIELSEDQTEECISNDADSSQDEAPNNLELPNLQLAMTADLTSYFKVGKKKCATARASGSMENSENPQEKPPDEPAMKVSQNEKAPAQRQASTPVEDGPRTSTELKWQSLPKKFKEEHWDLVLQWLEGEYEESSSVCLPRLVMFNHYLDMCKSRGLVPATQGTFGRMIMQRFKQLSMRRLGSRGNSQYCYMGVDVREESSHYDHISQHRVVCTLGKPKHSTFPQGKVNH